MSAEKRVIAFDASALTSPVNGIGRYLRELLARMPALAPQYRWLALGRSAHAVLDGQQIEWLGDGWPRDAGRVASLFVSQPRWLQLRSPDLVWGPAHRLPMRIPRRVARVVTIHDLCWRHAPETMRVSTRWLDRMLMPRAVREADRVIAVSVATRDALATAFPAQARNLRMVHEAAGAMTAPGSREMLQSLGIELPFVLFVGTVEPRKNLSRLVQAIDRVEGFPQLVIAGSRGWGASQPSLAADRRLRWLGAVDDATLATLYAHAEFLALPSLYEGFGLPLLEALSHGTPVLFGDNSSMPEVAGDAGLGVNAESVESIADGLARLLTDDGFRHQLASRARAQAAKFSWDRAARETLAVFEDAVAARQSRRA